MGEGEGALPPPSAPRSIFRQDEWGAVLRGSGVDQGQGQPLKAALWMGGAIVSFVLMAVAGRAVQVELNTFELMFWRSLIGFAIVVAIIRLRHGGFALVRTQHPGLHLTRNVFISLVRTCGSMG